MILTIIIFLLVLSVLVLFHEAGHFVAARLFKVRVDEFGLGFPPRVFGYQKGKMLWGNKQLEENEAKKGTIYSINLIPLGGFCKIKGQDDDDEKDPESFASKSTYKKIIILIAGVLMNIVLAIILFSACFMIGVPQAVEGRGNIQIEQVIAETPAASNDLRAGDIILDIGGQSFSSIEELQNFVASHKNENLQVHIKRGQEDLTKTIKPEVKDDGARMGIALMQTEITKYPWYQAIWNGFKYSFLILWLIIVTLYELVKGLIIGQPMSGAQVAGPVGIATLTGQMARLGWVYLLQFTALLSLNLTIINFLPFPALDGGRILFLLIGKVKGSPVKRNTETIIHNIGFFLLLALMAWVTIKEIINLF